MSLFIGNISKSVNHDDLEDAFKKFGPCKYRIKVCTLP
jgi:RNA recognition motif-containing protein